MTSTSEGILPCQEIQALVRAGAIRSRIPIAKAQIQPASLDLRLGETAYRVRSGFLPEKRSVEKGVRENALYELDLRAGAVLEKGQIYLIPLQESLRLPREIAARSNPKSSTGRLDVFTRVVTDRNPRFDDIPAGYEGPLWLEVAPRSFPVRVRAGLALNQIRFSQGEAGLTGIALRELAARETLLFDEHGPISQRRAKFDNDGGFYLRIRLQRRGPVGYRAKPFAEVIDMTRVAAYDPADYWEPVYAPKGKLIVKPEEFYIFASKERIAIPPDYAAEMLAYDVGIGELRTNYAGFFDNGFGWRTRTGGTPGVLEVRAHDVPFQIEDGQVFFRLKFFRTLSRPKFLYGARGVGSSYQDQDLTLAKQFRRFR